jgi:hypothetical protein
MVESEVWFYWMVVNQDGFKETTMAISIKLTVHTFLVIDLVGLHASFRGHEVAWTREYGWVRG